MTKRHFEAIASIINDAVPSFGVQDDFTEGRQYALENVTDDLVVYFKSINQNFDEKIFRTACGL